MAQPQSLARFPKWFLRLLERFGIIHSPMDYLKQDPAEHLMLLRMFQLQTLLQCDYALYAAQELNKALAERDEKRLFYAVQSYLTATANISKALWSQSGKLAKKRAALRATIGVKDDSPLRRTTMRNNYDHYDERLLQWWHESPQRNHLDMCIMKHSDVVGVAEIDRFRVFDDTTNEAHFWGDTFDIQATVNEISRILPRLRAEAAKPQWVP